MNRFYGCFILFLLSLSSCSTQNSNSPNDTFFSKYPDNYSLAEGWYRFYISSYETCFDQSNCLQSEVINTKLLTFYFPFSGIDAIKIQGKTPQFYYSENNTYINGEDVSSETESNEFYYDGSTLCKSISSNSETKILKMERDQIFEFSLSIDTYFNRWDKVINDSSFSAFFSDYELRLFKEENDYELRWCCSFNEKDWSFSGMTESKNFKLDDPSKTKRVVSSLWTREKCETIDFSKAEVGSFDIPSLDI